VTGPADLRLGPGGEFDRIRAFVAAQGAGSQPAGGAVLVGPGDDCAVVRAADLAVSTDMVVEDVHFRRAWLTPEEIGWRAVAAALSDLAAVAALPTAVLLSMAVRTEDAGLFAEGVMRGGAGAAAAAGAVVVGGDLTRSPGPLVLDVVVLGQVSAPVLRRGARAGDTLWVTGRLGAAGAALAAWLGGAEPSPDARRAFARPVPRTAAARWLAERGVPHAMIDLSDGLGGDAGHLAAASGVRIILEGAAIPIHPAALAAAASAAAALRTAVTAGEDYELCFAGAEDEVRAVRAAFEERFGLPLTRVGSVAEGSGAALLLPDGARVDPPWPAFSHFGGERP